MASTIPPPPDASPDSSPSLTRLLRDFANDTVTLLRQEIALAKAEVRQNVRDITGHFSQMAIGGGVALVGALVMVAFLVVALGVLLGGAYWLSSLIVAVLLLVAGGALGYLGVRRLSRESLAPLETLESVEDTKDWARKEMRDFRGALKGRVEGTAFPPDREVALPPSTWLAAPDQHPNQSLLLAELDNSTDKKTGRPPLSMPLPKRVFTEIQDDDVLGQGAKVAFYMFSSLPPALLVIFALTGLFGGDATADFITSRLQGVLPGSPTEPESAAGFVSQFVNDVVHDSAPGPLSIGLLLGLWASSAVFVALTEALNKAFDVVEDRSWFRKRALAVGVMLGFALLFLGGSVALVAGPGIAEALRLGPLGSAVWLIAQWPLAFALVVLAFFMVYYFLPNRDQSACRKVLAKASAIAAALWLLATVGFRLYIDNFGSYSATYGFVGAIMVILLWMYVTSVVILVGGEISSEMERTPA